MLQDQYKNLRTQINNICNAANRMYAAEFTKDKQHNLINNAILYIDTEYYIYLQNVTSIIKDCIGNKVIGSKTEYYLNTIIYTGVTTTQILEIIRSEIFSKGKVK